MRRALVLLLAIGCGGGKSPGDPPDAGDDAAVDTQPPIDAPANLDNRDRLIASYLAYLKANPSVVQSNGLSGATVSTVCDVWSRLQPAAQGTFLTITARLDGSKIGADGSTMLDHITKLYRVVGGDAATTTDPGSCGGGEFNRMIMSMDAPLHTALAAAFTHKGAKGANGYDIADIPATSYWRDSHDLGGPHTPFDQSDETNQGAPRGQVQYFKDAASTLANSPLGRMDLTTLVDPLAIEMDQDYDCAHNSNPLCSYTLYGPACFPESSMTGVDIYTTSYGSVDPGWKPTGC